MNKYLLGALLLALPSLLFAQAPNISYPASTILTTGKQITPITPNNTGGDVPANTYALVSTMAGGGTPTPINGIGTAATFNIPIGVATDAAGNVYVADSNDNLIRKISPSGLVTTFAGSGLQGSDNGTGTAASFSFPVAVATDAAGNVYVADSNDNLIRKISPLGVVTTLAGSGLQGAANGTGTAASFSNPTGVATDAAGNVYVADSNNNLIRKISPTGVVTTLAGSGSAGSSNGTGTAASFYIPSGIATDAAGNVYVSDDNNLIRKISPLGVVTTFAGSGYNGSNNGIGTAASFSYPKGVATDGNGNVYVADIGNNLIRKISPAGEVSTLAGNGSYGSLNGTGTAASFNYPNSVAIDANANIYVADRGNNLIRKINPSGVVSTFAGSGLSGSLNGTGTAASFSTPTGVATDATGNIYVADQSNNLIRKISPSGVVSILAGSGLKGSTDGTGSAATFYSPTGVATDAAGNIYVADTYNNLIRKISPSGVVSTLAGDGSSGLRNGTGAAASFNRPTGVATDLAGNIYVADSYNNIIRKINPLGVVSTFAGSGIQGSANGTGTAASFSNPLGVATDAAGNVYVADSYNSLVRKISPAGVVTTFAGNGSSGSSNGPAAAATFNSLSGVTIDAIGNVYVADWGNNLIRKISLTGEVTTLAGASFAFQSSTNGIGTDASFFYPNSVTVDAAGNLYVADEGNNLIRKISTTGYAFNSPSLPAGLVFDPTTGTISGTPTIVSPTTKFTVTAYNLSGSSTNTFSLAVVFSNDATLSNMVSSGGLLTPGFSQAITNYTQTVGSATTNITITPTTNNTNATVTINGVVVKSGSASANIFLNYGNNTITTLVTAQDGISTQTYTLIVNRVFTLPPTNFNITVNGETCNGSSNGSVAIAASANLNYTAVLTGSGLNTNQKFTNTTTFNNLPIGTYTLTFTVDGQANYSSTYTVTVTQPQPLSVYASVNNALGTINLALSGGAVYHIQVNNKTYTTTESSFSVPLEPGNNALQVTTDKECQGIFTKVINQSFISSPYPMPFESTLNLNLGSANLATVSIRIYSANTGLQVFKADYQNQSGVLQLDLSKLDKGAYGLQLIINNTKKEYKIIK